MNSISLTAYDVLKHQHVVLTADAVTALTERLTARGTSPIDHRTHSRFDVFADRLERHSSRLAALRTAGVAAAVLRRATPAVAAIKG